MTINSIFSDIVQQYSDKQALVFPSADTSPERALTYSELDQRSSRLAGILAEKGVSKGSHVVILLNRSISAIETMLAIIKLGAVYVPVEPTYPENRIRYIIDDASPDLIVSFSGFKPVIDETKRIPLYLDSLSEGYADQVELDDNIVPLISGEDLAYIIYTSGSTGNPKGVMVPQRGIIRLVKGAEYATFDDEKVFLQLATLSFDAATFEIWGALLNGATLVLYPDDGIPDPEKLQYILKKYKVSTLWLTASLFNSIIDEKPECLLEVEELLTGGEALSVPHILKARKLLSATQLVNGYGPTENTTFTCCYSIPDKFDSKSASVPIGYAINQTTVHIVDEDLKLVGQGEEGELLTGGEGVALGYLNKQELTEKVFIANPFDKKDSSRLYRTGDRVRQRKDGAIEFLGRIDSQVKISGYRIELGEIESKIKQQQLVRDAVVLVNEKAGVKKLVAYIVLNNVDLSRSLEKVKEELNNQLPLYMQPTIWMTLDKIPINTNGKLDRKKLPLPDNIRPDTEVPFLPARNDSQQSLVDIWQELLKLDRIGIDDNVFEMGATSIMCLKFVSRLKTTLDLYIPIEKVFQYPSIKSLLENTVEVPANPSKQQVSITSENADIAIIGLAGRFPGARNVDEFWENLCNGEESISFFDDEQLASSIPTELKNNPNYVKARGVLADIALFDAGFFGISPREAEIMDPQQRIFLELSWQALENAGYTPGADFDGKVGVFAGMNNNTYFDHNVRSHKDKIAQYGEFNAMVANEKDFLTTRASFKLNLKGPSVNVFSACSTSLVAVGHAVDSLRKGQCSYALAGGISIIVPQQEGYLYQEGSMLSADGHCRPFDAEATGATFNSGAGLVVLKRLDEARVDNDTIYAVIKGVGINNDGSEKASFTAPSIDGQADAIESAYQQAGFSADSVSYIETHGTGTPLGDPIEVAGLKKVFRTLPGDSDGVALGSVKGNVGHLVHAAGVTGLIKVALSLKSKLIPPSINYSNLNPRIDFESLPFSVNDQLKDWDNKRGVRRAGVSSFGVGGTNAHVALEEYIADPEVEEDTLSEQDVMPQVMILSGRTGESLLKTVDHFNSHIQNSDQSLVDMAYTLQVGRKDFNHRFAFVARSLQDARTIMQDLPADQIVRGEYSGEIPPVVFLFPGQGSQYAGMGRDLYQKYEVFRQAFDECSQILLSDFDLDLSKILLHSRSDNAAVELLKQTHITQPALFTVEYALARLWMSLGIQPELMAGHSLGEFVAACLAEVMSLPDAMRIVVERARLMQSMPPGIMLSVRSTPEAIQSSITGKVSLAAVNSPNLCVLSGPQEEIELTQQKLESEDIACTVLHTSHAFHSVMMEPVLRPFRKICKSIQLNPPVIPLVSTVTGQLLTEEQALDPEYWASHLRNTVRFSDAINTIWEERHRLLLEVGPRTVLTTLARQHIKDRSNQFAIASLTDNSDEGSELIACLKAMAGLWVHGVKPDWKKCYSKMPARIPLPGHAFERKKFWLDPVIAGKPLISEPEFMSIPQPITHHSVETMDTATAPDREKQIISDIRLVIEDTSGILLKEGEERLTFLDLGLDSLILTQASLALKNKFNVEITFRQLLENYTCMEELAGYLDEVLPEDQYEVVITPSVSQAQQSQLSPVASMNPVFNNPSSGTDVSVAHQVISQQLQFLSQQLAALGNGQVASVGVTTPVPEAKKTPERNQQERNTPASSSSDSSSRMARIQKSTTEKLNLKQQANLGQLINRYNRKTVESKAFAQKHRKQLSDPRTVSGFKPLIKEMVYPIVTDKASGSRLWDIDGNEYIDITCGFGVNYFGWSPDFVTKAVTEQLEKGIEVGPQTPLAGIVAEKICRMTGSERVAFCNTGSEAVLASIRMARTVTGRNTMVMFAGGYHGIFDEVVVRGSDSLRSFPAAPGIPQSMVENMLVLEYGTDETLEIIRSRADEIAGILVETVQSRRPDLQPVEFLKELRKITEDSGSALIFDEVVTGFRVHQGGAQAYFDIRADIATYGKVIGGGLPIGVVAGKSRFLDVLDGGQWEFGDDSIPEVGVTFFAGTFVRQPLGLAAANAVLDHLEEQGPELQQNMGLKVKEFVLSINQFFEEQQAGFKLTWFSSFFYLSYNSELPHGGLLFYYLRLNGIHIWEARPCFFTTQHSQEDIATVARAFKDSVKQMQQDGFLPMPEAMVKGSTLDKDAPPVEGARLGKNRDGLPAWFIEDEDNPGRYLEIKASES